MTDLPADIRDHYRRLAQVRRWPRESEAAFLGTVAWFRAIDEGPGVRRYYERADEEGLAEQGTRWLWETVIVNGAVTAVKQMEIPLHGPVRRYWWRWLEDDDSGLPDHALVPDEDGLRQITRELFYQEWDSRAYRLGGLVTTGDYLPHCWSDGIAWPLVALVCVHAGGADERHAQRRTALVADDARSARVLHARGNLATCWRRGSGHRSRDPARFPLPSSRIEKVKQCHLDSWLFV